VIKFAGMVEFRTTILKFDEKGEKTGWSYILISQRVAQRLHPGDKKSFRVKGKLDQLSISKVALLPMGEGNFIMPLNAKMRKAIGKRKGASVYVRLEPDLAPLLPDRDLMLCMKEEPEALAFFNGLPKSHQNYFSKWIASAKTQPTRAKRIAQAITALSAHQKFNQMLRAIKSNQSDSLSINHSY
jgi:hypothetical protein